MTVYVNTKIPIEQLSIEQHQIEKDKKRFLKNTIYLPTYREENRDKIRKQYKKYMEKKREPI